jgi:hypothetical protein
MRPEMVNSVLEIRADLDRTKQYCHKYELHTYVLTTTGKNLCVHFSQLLPF